MAVQGLCLQVSSYEPLVPFRGHHKFRIGAAHLIPLRRLDVLSLLPLLPLREYNVQRSAPVLGRSRVGRGRDLAEFLFGVETLLLPRTAALRTLNTFLREKTGTRRDADASSRDRAPISHRHRSGLAISGSAGALS